MPQFQIGYLVTFSIIFGRNNIQFEDISISAECRHLYCLCQKFDVIFFLLPIGWMYSFFGFCILFGIFYRFCCFTQHFSYTQFILKYAFSKLKNIRWRREPPVFFVLSDILMIAIYTIPSISSVMLILFRLIHI